MSTATATAKSKTSSKPATKATKKPKGPKVTYAKGDVTRAGAEVVKQHVDESYGVHRHRLTVRCVVTNKAFEIATQDAFQVRFHPDVPRKERKAWKLENLGA